MATYAKYGNSRVVAKMDNNSNNGTSQHTSTPTPRLSQPLMTKGNGNDHTAIVISSLPVVPLLFRVDEQILRRIFAYVCHRVDIARLSMTCRKWMFLCDIDNGQRMKLLTPLDGTPGQVITRPSSSPQSSSASPVVVVATPLPRVLPYRPVSVSPKKETTAAATATVIVNLNGRGGTSGTVGVGHHLHSSSSLTSSMIGSTSSSSVAPQLVSSKTGVTPSIWGRFKNWVSPDPPKPPSSSSSSTSSITTSSSVGATNKSVVASQTISSPPPAPRVPPVPSSSPNNTNSGGNNSNTNTNTNSVSNGTMVSSRDKVTAIPTSSPPLRPRAMSSPDEPGPLWRKRSDADYVIVSSPSGIGVNGSSRTTPTPILSSLLSSPTSSNGVSPSIPQASPRSASFRGNINTNNNSNGNASILPALHVRRHSGSSSSPWWRLDQTAVDEFRSSMIPPNRGLPSHASASGSSSSSSSLSQQQQQQQQQQRMGTIAFQQAPRDGSNALPMDARTAAYSEIHPGLNTGIYVVNSSGASIHRNSSSRLFGRSSRANGTSFAMRDKASGDTGGTGTGSGMNTPLMSMDDRERDGEELLSDRVPLRAREKGSLNDGMSMTDDRYNHTKELKRASSARSLSSLLFTSNNTHSINNNNSSNGSNNNKVSMDHDDVYSDMKVVDQLYLQKLRRDKDERDKHLSGSGSNSNSNSSNDVQSRGRTISQQDGSSQRTPSASARRTARRAARDSSRRTATFRDNHHHGHNHGRDDTPSDSSDDDSRHHRDRSRTVSDGAVTLTTGGINTPISPSPPSSSSSCIISPVASPATTVTKVSLLDTSGRPIINHSNNSNNGNNVMVKSSHLELNDEPIAHGSANSNGNHMSRYGQQTQQQNNASLRVPPQQNTPISNDRVKQQQQQQHQAAMATAAQIAALELDRARRERSKTAGPGTIDDPSDRVSERERDMARNQQRKLEMDRQRHEDERKKRRAEGKSSPKAPRRQLAERDRFWVDTVIPRWDVVCNSPLVRKIWDRDGVPAAVRGHIWLLAIGNQAAARRDDYHRNIPTAEQLMDLPPSPPRTPSQSFSAPSPDPSPPVTPASLTPMIPSSHAITLVNLLAPMTPASPSSATIAIPSHQRNINSNSNSNSDDKVSQQNMSSSSSSSSVSALSSSSPMISPPMSSSSSSSPDCSPQASAVTITSSLSPSLLHLNSNGNHGNNGGVSVSPSPSSSPVKARRQRSEQKRTTSSSSAAAATAASSTKVVGELVIDDDTVTRSNEGSVTRVSVSPLTRGNGNGDGDDESLDSGSDSDDDGPPPPGDLSLLSGTPAANSAMPLTPKGSNGNGNGEANVISPTPKHSFGFLRRQSIESDIYRMFPSLTAPLLREEGSLYYNLRQLLETFCNYRPDVSYVQGMTYLAAMFLAYMEPSSAFIALVNLFNCDYFPSYMAMNVEQIRLRFQIFESIFEANLPPLYKRFHDMNVVPDCYLMEWCMTLFSKQLPLPIASRIWDGYFLHGELFIFKSAAAILKLLERQLSTQSASLCMRLLRSPLLSITEPALMEAVRSMKVPVKVQKYYDTKKHNNPKLAVAS